MLAGVSSHRAVAPPAVTERLGSCCSSSSWIVHQNAADRGPSLAKCGRIGRYGKVSALAREADSSSESVKIGTLKQRESQGYPVSLSIYHNVQEGDTLTSIARKYNTSLTTIALANKIEDVDLVQAGQVLLVPVHPKVFQKVTAFVLQDTSQNGSPKPEPDIFRTTVQAPSTPVIVSGLQNFVRFAAPLLLLAPIIAFCFRGLIQDRIKLEVARTQAEKDVQDAQHRPRLKRWQGILDGDRDTEAVGEQSMEQAGPETEEERKKREDDELRESYVELEARYIKFLADSGLSRSGYWRGGIPSSG